MALIKCPECGKDVSEKCIKCPQCGYPINRLAEPVINAKQTHKAQSGLDGKTIGVLVAIASVVVLLCIVVFSQKPASYTYTSNTTSKTTSQTKSTYSEVATAVLKISDAKVSSNSSYTIVTGTITNNGKNTYTFVKVKGAFQNSAGKTIDTDWTYAVGSEGLAPGESTTFRMSVSEDSSIKKCDVSIYEYKAK